LSLLVECGDTGRGDASEKQGALARSATTTIWTRLTPPEIVRVARKACRSEPVDRRPAPVDDAAART
jgi:hypothetical protein